MKGELPIGKSIDEKVGRSERNDSLRKVVDWLTHGEKRRGQKRASRYDIVQKKS